MPRPKTLTYAMNRKTDKLLKIHKKRNTAMIVMIPVGAVAGLLWVYVIGNIDHYLSQWSSLFSGSANGASTLTFVESTILTALIITSIAFGYIFAIWNKHNEKYDKLKEEILQILELKACYHKEPCCCNDEYCQWLEQEEGVDLF